MAIDQDITNLPTPPSRSDSPSDFSDKADSFLGALPQLQTELNTYADEANATQQVINTSESNAATSETNAEDWASKTDGIVLTTDYSAKAYAISDNLIPEGAAKEWAIKIGGTVDGTEFSAKKYANDAEASASAAAATAGATAWSSGTTYDTNDAAIGSDGSTYRSLVDGNLGNDPVTDSGANWLNLTATLSDQEVRDLFSSGGDLNYDSTTGVFSVTTPDLVLTPENIAPTDGATGALLSPELDASAYRSLYGVPMASAQWQISEVSDFATTVVDETVAGTSTTFTPSSNLDPDSQYFWRVRYTDEDGETSEFSEATTFTTANIFTAQPTITAPADGATDISEQPIIESSAFDTVNGSDTHVASQWVITRVSDGVEVFDSGEDTSNLESIQVPAGILDEGGENYTVKVRHKGSTYGFSAYSPDSAFTTSSVFFEYITSNIGQPHEGGFYAGNVVSDVDGITYAIIVSDGGGDTDRTGAGDKQWRTSQTALTQAQTLADGRSVMDHIVANETLSNFPAFEWIQNNLNSGSGLNGYTDWYLPARDELELVYRHFKPTTDSNDTGSRPTGGFGGDGATYGTNNSSDPNGLGYTTSDPSQTTVTSFQFGNADHLTDSSYWSSTEYDASFSWGQKFVFGTQDSGFDKDGTHRVRAVRRVQV